MKAEKNKRKSTNKETEDWSAYYLPEPSRFPPKKRTGRSERIIFWYRVAVALVIFLVLLTVRHTEHPLGRQAREGLKYMLTTEWNYQPILEQVVRLGLLTANVDHPYFSGGQGRVSEALSGGISGGELPVPVSGKVIKPFGWVKDPVDGMERFHSGIDIKTGEGALVKAVLDGTVHRVGLDNVLGQYILLHHGDENYTLYAQVSDVRVDEGQQVKAGEVIAKAGKEGDISGYGLHFEVREGGKLVDPLTRIKRESQKW